MKKMHGISTKAFAALLAVTLLVGSAIGGTLAWLTSKSDSLVNTFTIGNVAITLEETTGNDYKVTPGVPVAKDPKVTVTAGSEACWVFVEIQESENWPDGLTYEPAAGWTPLTSEAGVYYRDVASDSSQNQDFYVLAGEGNGELQNGMITVSEDINTLGETEPSLTFTAYAIQKEGIETAEDAWDKLNTQKGNN